MISFWSPAAGTFGLTKWMALRAPELTTEVEVRTYEELTPELEVTRGAHIFAGLER